jgi:4-amino-4-deoxy-L-arabinose transferase-like glycosyltransferase
MRTWFWILAVLSALVTLAPIRVGDLAGYDDARYALVAKDIVQNGDWLDIRSNGGPALEHPPLLSWIQAVLFLKFGFSDPLAKLPSAVCGLATILLVYWLARRLTGDSFVALVAMFVMAGSIYFLKYAARAMTDVPFTFFTLGAVCAWVLAKDNARWYLAVGAFVAMAQMTRAMMGLGLPVIFLIDAVVTRRRPPLRWMAWALVIAFLPPLAWYAQWIYRYGRYFFEAHAIFLREEVYGGLSPAWRRYTGAPEYVWMVAKSYWPWLPFMITGLILVVRSRDRKLSLLITWTAVIFALCAITRSRVLRYMLPAYPAFAVLTALGLLRLIPERYLRNALRIAIPILGVVVLKIAIFPPVNWHAAETRPVALAATAATEAKELVTFYDAGQPRYDETNQLLWYGDRLLIVHFNPDGLLDALRRPRSRVFVVDQDTYDAHIRGQIPHQVVTHSGHLVCVRLCYPDQPCPEAGR